MKKNTRSKEKQKQLQNDILDPNFLKNTIQNIYLTEFEDLFCQILTVNDFIKQLNQKSMSTLINLYTDSILTNSSIMNICKDKESYVLNHYYNPNLKILKNAWAEYQINLKAISTSKLSKKNNECFSYLNTFIPHCNNNNTSVAIHECGERLLTVHDSSNNVTHAICIGCKSCYFAECIKLFCITCQIPYYSKFLNDKELKEELVIATWEKYHCNQLINDHMRCIKCNEAFYLNRKSNILRCKKCKIDVKPSNIAWQCLVCKLEFKCQPKQYFPLEFKIVRDAIKETLSKKELALPSSTPCCEKLAKEFFHKKECTGMIYQGTLFNKPIIVCEKCRAMNFFERFTWTCPVCFKKFRQKQKEPTSASESKNISTQETPKINNNFKSAKNIQISPDKFEERPRLNTTTGVKQTTSSNELGINKKVLNESQSVSNFTTGNSETKRVFNFKPKNLIDILDNRKGSIKDHKRSSSNNYADEIVTESKEMKNPRITERRISRKNLENIFDKTEVPKEEETKKPKLKISLIEENKEETKKLNNKLLMTNMEENKIMNDSKILVKSPYKNLKSTREFDINDYKIIQQIGEGTYGKIYKVIDSFNNKYAMKKIICHNKNELKLTKSEFTLVENNPHENIVRIEGITEKELDETTFALYILLEIAESDWEAEVSKRAKTFRYYTEKELINIMKQLVSCLAFLQSKKIAHRDIKPQNILVFSGFKYKLADFGEAKQSTINKQTNTLRGTELYMSPLLFEKLREEANNANDTSPQAVKHNIYKSDVFSLGYCFIYASTLTFETLGEMREISEMEIIEKIIRKHFKRRYSDKFINLILRMIDFKEKNRFEFIELLEYIEGYYSK